VMIRCVLLYVVSRDQLYRRRRTENKNSKCDRSAKTTQQPVSMYIYLSLAIKTDSLWNHLFLSWWRSLTL